MVPLKYGLSMGDLFLYYIDGITKDKEFPYLQMIHEALGVTVNPQIWDESMSTGDPDLDKMVNELEERFNLQNGVENSNANKETCDKILF